MRPKQIFQAAGHQMGTATDDRKWHSVNIAGSGRNHRLDGLRGYAALAVAVFHTILSIDESLVNRIVYGNAANFHDSYSWFAKVTLKLFSGETAVFIFFVLSGAVLSRSLIQVRSPFFLQASDFTVKRAFRIFPALLLNLLVMAACLAAVGKPVTAGDFVVNALLLKFPINGATWTLNVEMIAVLFILAAYAGWCLAREWGLIVASIALDILLQFSISKSLVPLFRDQWTLFALGMLIPTGVGWWITRRMPLASAPLVLLVAIALKGTIQPVAIAIFVALLYYNRAGKLGAFLEKPFSRYLGRISYSFYLYNPVVLCLIAEYPARWPLAHSHPIEIGLLVAFPVVLATMCLAHASTRYVEQPAIALGRSLALRIGVGHHSNLATPSAVAAPNASHSLEREAVW
ncbi:acyltransferase [Bradyrhizobium sp. MOS002]|uniref:acyltransferase family protein n=1 Tax=Bradyrhizobium sp. MOS002 TaxID=2133947 RepID=UPI000D120A94|nr:acyltransferase [Bradyrhizobium sp. MOS002]PSO25950.1 acyltransferase [Bradyrhizobium sp. MOS002]